MSRHDHHVPCPCGAELADECPKCARTNPLGAVGIEPRIGSDERWPWTGVRVGTDHTTRAHDGATTDREQDS